VSNLRSCDSLAYSNNERAKQLLYALDDHVWGIKIADLDESTDFATLDTKKLFSKLKSHELSRKGRPNSKASFTSKAFITSAHVGGHDANPTNITVLSALEFPLSSLVAASDEQYLVFCFFFRYLKHTLEFEIWYSASSSLDLVGFFDADFAGCEIDH
jgi:hypothetical protein